jgi:DNA-directed RNA polymerase specialized sigma24 family protein
VRHGGNCQRVELGDVEISAPGKDNKMLAVDDALDKLAGIDAVQAEVVKLRWFVGMTNAETAQALAIPEHKVKYYWSHARARLIHEMNAARKDGQSSQLSQQDQ